jgi:hypothetical protein
MMTMLVATLGLLPAALSHEIGSDSQRPFAIVIVGGLIAALGMSIFLLPTLYVWIAHAVKAGHTVEVLEAAPEPGGYGRTLRSGGIIHRTLLSFRL